MRARVLAERWVVNVAHVGAGRQVVVALPAVFGPRNEALCFSEAGAQRLVRELQADRVVAWATPLR